MNRRRLLAAAGTLGTAATAGCLALAADDDGELVVDETVPAGASEPAFAFEAEAGQTLFVDVDWDRDAYDGAIGLLVAREPVFDFVRTGERDPTVDEDEIFAADQLASVRAGETVIRKTTPARFFRLPIETGGRYEATVTMEFVTDSLPEERPVDVELAVGVGDDPGTSPI